MDKKTILLVEDDQLDIISVQRSLNKLELPYQLHTAFNGIEALEMLRGSAGKAPITPLPDIILLDINMPKMNGIEFLRALRREVRFNDIKVFIMTTSGEQADRTETEQLGISGYLIKPLNFSNNTKRADSMDGFVQFYIGKILREG
ncbi:response regulator [Puia sp.]|jgi:CheY-like chemotaxis protein|uniref:response regulator n=1 Tax=Puia sp. TaxID=2045100 RepID=UPI002F41EEA5